ncbi:MAG TPA: BPTI/Kunitz domain-containing protein [Polyangiaceae bacterium]
MLGRRLGGIVLVVCVAGLLASCGQSAPGDREHGGKGGKGGTASGSGGTGGSGAGTSGSSVGGNSAGGTTSGGTGGSLTGGASGTSGNGVGGGATGGAGGAMGGGTTGGSGGAGGEPSHCSLPPEPGECLGSIRRLAFEPTTGLCLPFVYGGCGGNANNFETAEECYAACGGHGEQDLAACEYPTDCTLVPAACCGCVRPDLGNTIAVARSRMAELEQARGCGLVDCVSCQPLENPWLGVTCRAGRCVGFDARRTELVTCETSDDCRFRAGLQCCENCFASRQSFIAVSADADVHSWVCGDAPVGCAGCVPTVPQNLSAVCADGTCGVLDAELPQ